MSSRGTGVFPFLLRKDWLHAAKVNQKCRPASLGFYGDDWSAAWYLMISMQSTAMRVQKVSLRVLYVHEILMNLLQSSTVLSKANNAGLNCLDYTRCKRHLTDVVNMQLNIF